MESVIFENQTDLPIILETWKPISSGLSSTFVRTLVLTRTFSSSEPKSVLDFVSNDKIKIRRLLIL